MMDFQPIQSELISDYTDCGTLESQQTGAASVGTSESSDTKTNTILSVSHKVGRKQIAILALILAAGLATGQCVGIVFDLQHVQNTFVGRFVIGNAAAIVVALGFATYGCILNRQLERTIQDHKQLGPYTLLELIGSGGMGDVYLAEHQLLKRRCAVKLIKKDRASDRRMLVRFEREVKATARLTHWNTVQVYDYGRTANGTFYYAMELLQGLNLRQLVEKYGRQSPGRVVYILRQLCSSLHEAHSYGLVHRDIKPSNIFLAERGRMYDVAKLLDFGLVRPASLGLDSIRCIDGRLQGSPRFMCPEQARGQKPDTRGDLYSLAAVGYYLLTGRPPFDDDNPVFLVIAHATARVPAMHELGIEVPQDLSDVIMKCLSKVASDRFPGPRELLTALENCKCASEWTWREAEEWWQQNSNAASVNGRQIPPIPPRQVTPRKLDSAEHDKTMIPEDSVVFGGVF